MQFEYSITIDDVAESSRPTKPDGQPIGRGSSLGRGLLGWVVFLVLAVLILWMVTNTSAPRAGRVARAPLVSGGATQNLWVTLTPSLVPAGMFVLLVAVGLVQAASRARRATAAIAAGRPMPPAPRAQRWTGFFIMAPAAFILVCNAPSLAIPWSPEPGDAMWIGLAPWGVALLLIGVLAVGGNRRAAKRQWSTTPSLQRRLTADIADDGIRASDGVTDTHYRWAGIIRYRETENLYVLTLEDNRTLLLPKRSIPDDATVRQVIHEHVADGTFLPRAAAFPVAVSPVSADNE